VGGGGPNRAIVKKNDSRFLRVSNWMQRILKVVDEDPERVVITDRSPFSAAFYTQNGGKLLVPLIETCLGELKSLGIEFYTVHVKVDAEILWERIQQRLEIEPERALYKENSRAWMEEVKSFYDSFPLWSFTVKNNTGEGMEKVINELLGVLATRSPRFSEANKRYYSCGSPLTLHDDAASVSTML